jgi:predicted N-acetyltransferase YhbS
MTVTIGQMRPADVQEVLALMDHASQPAQALAELLQDERSLSLVARDSDHDQCVVGAIVCHGPSPASYCHRFVIAPTHAGGELSRRLAGLAMRKLSTRGIHKCRLAAEDDRFWPYLRWHSQS